MASGKKLGAIKKKLGFFWRRETLFITISMLILLVGPDLSTHLHNSWLFHEFMTEGGLHLYDPYTAGGRQFMYSYGTVSYAMSGLLYHFLGPFVVDVLEITAFLIMAMLSYYLVRDWVTRAFWFMLMTMIVLADTFPNFMSMFLFLVAVYLYQKKKERLFQGFALLAGFNHPFVTLVSMFFISKNRKAFSTILVTILILQFTVLRMGFYETSGSSMIPTQLAIAVFRSFVLLFPFFLIPMEPTMRFYKLMNLLRYRRDLILTTGRTVIYLCAFYFIFLVPSVMALESAENFFTEDRFQNIPHIDGILRVVDDIYFDPIVHLPKKGVVLSNSQYFEGRETTFSGDVCGYSIYLIENEISFVLIREGAVFSENEESLLKENFRQIYEEDDYLLFDVRDADEIFSKQLECEHYYEFSSEYANVIHWGINVALLNVDEFSDDFEKLSKGLRKWSENISEIFQEAYSKNTY